MENPTLYRVMQEFADDDALPSTTRTSESTIMTDYELLALAAKAAGIKIHESDDGTIQKRPIWAVTHFVCGQPYGESEWNPLKDDGDALRLAVKLGICVFPRTDGKSEAAHTYHFIEENGDNPFVAMRRAIVRAAAEIGRRMSNENK